MVMSPSTAVAPSNLKQFTGYTTKLDFGHFRPADRLGVAGHSSATLLMMPLSMAAR
jgi:hypothetical protein